MDNVSPHILFVALAVLLFLSAFFSSSETGMMSLNRYRLRHLVKKKNLGAVRASQLLHRPDRLIGIILIGNNLVNVWIASIVTVLAVGYYGDSTTSWVISNIVLTMILLIFAEVTPKTLAATYPEKIAFPASFILKPLLWPLYPVVVFVNGVSNGLARLFGIKSQSKTQLTDHLHPEELRTVVDEAGDLIPDQHQGMLLNILDLEKATAEDIMIPRNDVIGIDLEDDINDIMNLIRSTEFTRLPVFTGDINNVVGVLHLRNAARFIKGDDSTVSKDSIRENMDQPYFVPESTALHTQLLNFQKKKQRLGIAVDEYGEVQGIVTLVDLLEEIVGEFATDASDNNDQEVTQLDDTLYLVNASASIRDINKYLGWELPTNGPKTINGLIVEFLESIPGSFCSFEIENYRFEITKLSDTRIEQAQICEVAPNSEEL